MPLLPLLTLPHRIWDGPPGIALERRSRPRMTLRFLLLLLVVCSLSLPAQARRLERPRRTSAMQLVPRLQWKPLASPRLLAPGTGGGEPAWAAPPMDPMHSAGWIMLGGGLAVAVAGGLVAHGVDKDSGGGALGRGLLMGGLASAVAGGAVLYAIRSMNARMEPPSSLPPIARNMPLLKMLDRPLLDPVLPDVQSLAAIDPKRKPEGFKRIATIKLNF